MNPPKKISVFSPATIANLGAGFDLLGLALEKPGDIITARRIREKKLVFISDPRYPHLPNDHLNVACHVAQTLYDILRPDSGVEIRLKKGIPESSGMGGSAASSAAAAFAMNALLGAPYSREELLPFALAGEKLASGSAHADNVAPSLFGGLCLISPGVKPQVIQLPCPNNLFWIVVHPELKCDTRSMRKILPESLPLATHTQQSGLLATLITGLLLNNEDWITRGMVDLIAEPQRAKQLPGFEEVRQAALTAGAIGFGISGSGPSLFALSNCAIKAEDIAKSMQNAFRDTENLPSQYYISEVNTRGTHLQD